MNSNDTLSAFVTNLGKYNEGELVGEWVKFPTTSETIQKVFDRIMLDSKNHEEYFITDYETTVDGLYDTLPEYANLSELNYLAAKLDDMAEYEIEKLEAVLDYQGVGGIADVINLADSLDSFDFMSGVHSAEDLGYYYIEDSGIYDKEALGSLANYIDYERFGRDVALDEGGSFTNKGYVRDTGDGISNDYKGIDDIPDEYFITAKPDNYLQNAEMGTEQNYNMIDGIMNNTDVANDKPSIREQLKPSADVSKPDKDIPEKPKSKCPDLEL